MIGLICILALDAAMKGNRFVNACLRYNMLFFYVEAIS